MPELTETLHSLLIRLPSLSPRERRTQHELFCARAGQVIDRLQARDRVCRVWTGGVIYIGRKSSPRLRADVCLRKGPKGTVIAERLSRRVDLRNLVKAVYSPGDVPTWLVLTQPPA